MVKKLQSSTTPSVSDVIAAAQIPNDDNLAGDIAAAAATGDATGLVQDGAVAIEATETIDGGIVAEVVIEARPNGDAAGDAAAAAVGGEAVVPISATRSIPMALRGEGNIVVETENTPESEPVNGEVGNSAGLSEGNAAIVDVHPDWAHPSEDGFRKAYPLTFAMVSGHQKLTPPVLRVTAKVAGFRRGGLVHPSSPSDHPALSLSPSQIEAILGEPLLFVEII